MISDPGYFGPNSMMWKVNKEITVLFGGARALLMHAAHPLIAAGAKILSRGGKIINLEGKEMNRLVVIEFHNE